MSVQRRDGLFLEQRSYRRRRLRDAAQVLPLLGTALVALPVLWPAETDAAGISTRGTGIYLFLVWTGLLIAAALLARALREDAGGPD